MFGFMGTPCRTCAGNENHSSYRAFFCGLSSCLSAEYGPAARLLVNRDSTFLSLLGASLSSRAPAAVANTCCNPLSIPKPLFQDDLHVQYAAAITICGLATKLQDDADDESGIRKQGARLLGKVTQQAKDQAISFLNTIRFPTREVEEAMLGQSALEKRRPNLLESASLTAHAYGKIFEHLATLAQVKTAGDTLRKTGQSLGRLIYWRDAYDDLSKDRVKNRFNPLQTSSQDELTSLFSTSAISFSHTLNDSSFLRLHQLRSGILSTTFHRHRALLTSDALAEAPVLQDPKLVKKEKKRRKKNDNFCSRHCDCSDCCCSFDCCGGCASCDCST